MRCLVVFRSRRQGLEGPWFGLAAPPTNGFSTLVSERWRKAASISSVKPSSTGRNATVGEKFSPSCQNLLATSPEFAIQRALGDAVCSGVGLEWRTQSGRAALQWRHCSLGDCVYQLVVEAAAVERPWRRRRLRRRQRPHRLRRHRRHPLLLRLRRRRRPLRRPPLGS